MKKFLMSFTINFVGLAIVAVIINLLMNKGTLDMNMLSSPLFWLIGLVITLINLFFDGSKNAKD